MSSSRQPDHETQQLNAAEQHQKMILSDSICRYPNAQFTNTGTGQRITGMYWYPYSNSLVFSFLSQFFLKYNRIH